MTATIRDLKVSTNCSSCKEKCCSQPYDWVYLTEAEISRLVQKTGKPESSFTIQQSNPATGVVFKVLNLPCAFFDEGSLLRVPAAATLHRIRLIQSITIGWMGVEAIVSLAAAWMARSPALLAFGGDSAIELLSAVAVFWRFRARAEQEREENRAAKIAGALLFLLAAYIVLASVLTLMRYSEPKPTVLGMAILTAAAGIMPWLTKEKRKLSAATGSAALRADAAQSGLCAYLSLIALAGLAVNAIWHLAWSDPVAALVVTPLIVWGRGARQCVGRRAVAADDIARVYILAAILFEPQ